jgi:N,N'-diacetyllegionaminate synthase
MTEATTPFTTNDQPCFIIAEAGVNHNGDLALAMKLIDAAREAGADAVKFQTFQAEQLVTAEAPQADYQARNSGRTESQLDMLKRLELPLSAFAELKQYCDATGIGFMSTAFDERSADYLRQLGMNLFKIPSGELTNLPLLRHIASFGLPMIVSTGMGNLEEIHSAVDAIRAVNNAALCVLHCVTDYPTAPEDANLRVMRLLAEKTGVAVGFSDHTQGIEAAVVAVAAGARCIEKHFTLDRNLPGPDHQASLEPDELRAMVQAIRRAEVLLGRGIKQPTASELQVAQIVRRSVVAACDIAAGQPILESHLTLRRPGTGIPPADLHRVIDKTSRRHLPAGSLIAMEDLA